MLLLDDPAWSQLEHAYGAASDIPGLLRTLYSSTGPGAGHDSEPWFGLWSRLCHQGDVYSASYATVPHIVEIASRTRSPIDPSFFLLPSAIEVARTARRGQPVSDDLGHDYFAALNRLSECVSVHSAEPWDQQMVLAVAAAQAIAKGHVVLAEAFLNLDDDWIGKINRDEFD